MTKQLQHTIWIIIIPFTISCFHKEAVSVKPDIAFFYGKPIPIELIKHHDWLILEGDGLDDISQMTENGTELFAYVSVGEVDQYRLPNIPMMKHWVLGTNPNWGNPIIDLSQIGWQSYLLEQQIIPLWEKGFQGFFLDTLDSYQIVTKTPKDKAAQAQALITFIHTIHRRLPKAKLLLNRGFDVLPAVAPLVNGVVAESLFHSWNPFTKKFLPVKNNDSIWLLDKLKGIQNQYHLPIIIIDYVPLDQYFLACQTAKRISDLGFIPWISTPSLDQIGIGLKESRHCSDLERSIN